MIDYDPDEFVDDWHCKDCEHGPIGIEKDACPVCGSTVSYTHLTLPTIAEV